MKKRNCSSVDCNCSKENENKENLELSYSACTPYTQWNLYFFSTLLFLFFFFFSSASELNWFSRGSSSNRRTKTQFKAAFWFQISAFLHVDLININLIQEKRKRKIDFFNAHSLCGVFVLVCQLASQFVLVRFGAAAVASFISTFFSSTIYLFICLLFPGR